MAAARELRVEISDEPGALGIVSALLGRSGINIEGFAVWLGTARLLVGRVDQAVEILEAEGFSCTIADVLRLDLPDEPGSLAEVSQELGRAGINIDYAYTVSARTPGAASFILAVIDPEAAEEILE